MTFTITRTSISNPTPDESPHKDAVFNENFHCWTIEIDSLEQLLGLTLEEAIVLFRYDNYPDIAGDIEIYDDYRE